MYIFRILSQCRSDVTNCVHSSFTSNPCRLMLFIGLNKKIHEITTKDLRYYLAMYQEQRKISLSYLETLRHYISSFFTWATDEGYINRDPSRRLRRVKVPQKLKKPYTAEEREHLKDIAKTERDVAIMELLYSTAGRIGEVVSINREDVDFPNREIVIYGQKGKKERKVYLTEGCIYHLKKYLASRTDDNPALFVVDRKPYSRLQRYTSGSCISKQCSPELMRMCMYSGFCSKLMQVMPNLIRPCYTYQLKMKQ